jgi:FkbM family methyltransferase
MEYILDKTNKQKLINIDPAAGDNIVVQTEYGQMLINRHDTIRGRLLMEAGRSDDHGDITMLASIIDILGPQSVVMDIGANFGTHTLSFAKNAGKVFSFEPQRAIFNILVANIALNSIYNVYCFNMAVSDKAGRLDIPLYDYSKPMDFGSVEFGGEQKYAVDQQRGKSTEAVQMITIDGLNIARVDLIKVDVEGMEQQVLDGAINTIKSKQPVMFVEHFKSNKGAITKWFEALNYKIYVNGMNLLCVPERLKETLYVTT